MSTEEIDPIERAQRVFDENEKQLRKFVLMFLNDEGIKLQILRVATEQLQSWRAAKRLINRAYKLIFPSDQVNFNARHLIDTAPAFELVVRYAREIGNGVIPEGIIPDQDVIDAMSTLRYVFCYRD